MSLPGGFVFHPSRYSPPIGHDGLDIELTEPRSPLAGCILCATFLVAASRPCERTFHDIHDEDGESELLRVCPGAFRLRAANDNIIYGFTFGGSLQIHAMGDHTGCDIASPAPIFNLAYGLESTNVFLFSEFMAMLARRRAVWNDDTRFGRSLVAARPFDVFIAILSSLADYLDRFRPSAFTGEYRRGAAAVNRWIDTLRDAGEWPIDPPRLEMVL